MEPTMASTAVGFNEDAACVGCCGKEKGRKEGKKRGEEGIEMLRTAPSSDPDRVPPVPETGEGEE